MVHSIASKQCGMWERGNVVALISASTVLCRGWLRHCATRHKYCAVSQLVETLRYKTQVMCYVAVG